MMFKNKLMNQKIKNKTIIKDIAMVNYNKPPNLKMTYQKNMLFLIVISRHTYLRHSHYRNIQNHCIPIHNCGRQK